MRILAERVIRNFRPARFAPVWPLRVNINEIIIDEIFYYINIQWVVIDPMSNYFIQIFRWYTPNIEWCIWFFLRKYSIFIFDARNSAGFTHWKIKSWKKNKKKGVTKQAKLPVGIRHSRGVDMENDSQVKLPVGIRNPNFSWNFIYLIRNARFDVPLDMRVHTTCGTSRANRVVWWGFKRAYFIREILQKIKELNI